MTSIAGSVTNPSPSKIASLGLGWTGSVQRPDYRRCRDDRAPHDLERAPASVRRAPPRDIRPAPSRDAAGAAEGKAGATESAGLISSS
jgi:hypothetical protein